MPISAEKLQTINAIGLTSARRLDGLAAYPPYPYTILRNATITVASALAQEGKIPRLLATLQEYERHGVFIHPKTAAFLLVMVDVYEGASARPMLTGESVLEEGEDEPIIKLARLIGESPSEIGYKEPEESSN